MIDFLLNIMSIDSTSGKENELGNYFKENFHPEGSELEVQEIETAAGIGQVNLFYKWGNPEIIFCSHYDTVPPYIRPEKKDGVIYGRGSCDAKGQIACLAKACKELFKAGETNFGLLILAGEEVGSYGAKKANQVIEGCKYVIVGEPTENKLIRAGKGNILLSFVFRGKSCHSGYPGYGDNAIERMRKFLNDLDKINFPDDPVLGKTTYNIGRLTSDNAHNVVSDEVKMKIFFRTTFATHDSLFDEIKKICDTMTEVELVYEDKPVDFFTVEGFETDIVAFGSDAPELYNLGKPLLYGPGSILNAHTLTEYNKIEEMEKAVVDLKKIFYKLKEKEVARH
jgi:acetylornithine deacetylase